MLSHRRTERAPFVSTSAVVATYPLGCTIRGAPGPCYLEDSRIIFGRGRG
jgi:hypothetical protein